MKTTVVKNGKEIAVSLDGRFTTDVTTEFLKDIESLMEERHLEITMDLGSLEFISSAGIRCFVMLLKACTANESTLCLKNLTPQIRDIFTLTSLIDKFKVE